MSCHLGVYTALLSSACWVCLVCSHALVGTEHVLWAMFHVHPVPTAAPWLGKWMTTKDVDAALDSVSTFAALPRPSQHVATTPRLDAVIEAGKAIARAVTAGQFTSDSFLVGMLIDGRNLAASVCAVGALTLRQHSRLTCPCVRALVPSCPRTLDY